jgi:anti-anti-sigma factor
MSDGTEIPAAVSWTRQGPVVVVRLSGAVDRELDRSLDALLRVVGDMFDAVIVDLEGVTFFGSTGLNFLARLAAAGGPVQLRGVPAHLTIPRQLRATGLDALVTWPS